MSSSSYYFNPIHCNACESGCSPFFNVPVPALVRWKISIYFPNLKIRAAKVNDEVSIVLIGEGVIHVFNIISIINSSTVELMYKCARTFDDVDVTKVVRCVKR